MKKKKRIIGVCLPYLYDNELETERQMRFYAGISTELYLMSEGLLPENNNVSKDRQATSTIPDSKPMCVADVGA